MISRSGDSLGALVFGSSEARSFQDLHVKRAEGIAAQSTIALDNARLLAEAERAKETLRQSNDDLSR